MTEGMRSVRRTLRGPSVLSKTKRNRVVLLRTRFTTLWRSEIHISLKIDADAPYKTTGNIIVSYVSIIF
jgi:hypothetical protein